MIAADGAPEGEAVAKFSLELPGVISAFVVIGSTLQSVLRVAQ
jgi:hypothetical protein